MMMILIMILMMILTMILMMVLMMILMTILMMVGAGTGKFPYQLAGTRIVSREIPVQASGYGNSLGNPFPGKFPYRPAGTGIPVEIHFPCVAPS